MAFYDNYDYYGSLTVQLTVVWIIFNFSCKSSFGIVGGSFYRVNENHISKKDTSTNELISFFEFSVLISDETLKRSTYCSIVSIEKYQKILEI